MNHLVPPGFLFRWSIPVRQKTDIPRRSGRLLDLPDDYSLPFLNELDSKPKIAEVRLAWNEKGIGITAEVVGRTRKLKYVPSSPDASDGLMIWVDTRNTQTVHRATRFCHQFLLSPGVGKNSPAVAEQIPLSRAREEASSVDVSLIQVQSDVRPDGYTLEAWLPAEVMVGYDPATNPRLGFHYLLRDLELGVQTLSVGTEFPAATDPSLWQTLELTGG